MADKEQIKKIYALGAACGLLDSSKGTDDELHLWARQWVPDKEHISELTDAEAILIIQHLQQYAAAVRKQSLTAAVRKQSLTADVISEGQIRKAFRLMYRLAELSPSDASPRDRLAGVVSAVIGRELTPKSDIFSGLSGQDGNNIIETLKNYIRNEERKKKRGERNGNVKSGGAPPS